LQCALVLSKHCTSNLNAHLGVSYGEMKLALLGGHNDQWVYLLNGECVSELEGCINDAGPKEVAATRQCYDQAVKTVQDLLVVKEKRNNNKNHDDNSSHGADATSVEDLEGHSPLSESMQSIYIKGAKCEDSDNFLIKSIQDTFSIENSESTKGGARKMSVLMQKHVSSREVDLTEAHQQELLKSAALFVPRPVLAAVNSESLDHIGELRQVTTMFLSLDSYSTTKHRDPSTLQPFFLMAQKVLFEAGGFLRQFLVDDKGCVFIAMWGMPSFTYANNCSRALYCAVSIAMQAIQLDHYCSIGITTGNIFCGSVGAAERRDYAGIGNEVNLAARLMSKARGRVLIDRTTYSNLNQTTRGLLVEAEEMSLKGMEKPITPFKYDSENPPRMAALDEGTGYGAILRKQTRHILSSQMDKITNADPVSSINDNKSVYFTIILGLPGTGKSTAAEYFRTGLRKRNIPVILIQARPGHEGVPYGLMRELFLELIGEDNFLTEAQQRRKIKSLIEQAYPNSNEEEKRRSRLSLQLLLGIEWSEDEPIARKDMSDPNAVMSIASSSEKVVDLSPKSPIRVASPRADLKTPHTAGPPPTSTVSEKENFNNMLEGLGSSLSRPVGDLTFYKVISAILRNQRSAIIIEDAHFCDELSWNELHLLLIGTELNLVVLLTMRSNPNNNNRTNEGGNANGTTTPKGKSNNNGDDDNNAPRRSSVYSKNFNNEGNNNNAGDFSDAAVTRYGLKNHTSAAYLSILGHENSSVIEMTSLGENEVRDILLQTLRVDTISVDLVKLVLNVSSGNAFWCKAIANFINERGIKELEKATEGEGRESSLKHLIILRMEKLTMDHQLVLKHASILGDEFSENMLEAVLPEKLRPTISESLDSLVEHGFIFCLEEFPQCIFAFQNQLIQQTVMELTPPRDASTIHLAAAEFIEREYVKNLRPFYPRYVLTAVVSLPQSSYCILTSFLSQ
jgi:class 3 adenylate cyclase